jgi:hypothetical protein
VKAIESGHDARVYMLAFYLEARQSSTLPRVEQTMTKVVVRASVAVLRLSPQSPQNAS